MTIKETSKQRFDYWMEFFKVRDRALYHKIYSNIKSSSYPFDPEFRLYELYVNMSDEYLDLWNDIDKQLFVQLTRSIARENNWSKETYKLIDKNIQTCIDKDEIFGLRSWAYFICCGDWLPASYFDIPENINRKELNIDFEQ